MAIGKWRQMPPRSRGVQSAPPPPPPPGHPFLTGATETDKAKLEENNEKLQSHIKETAGLLDNKEARKRILSSMDAQEKARSEAGQVATTDTKSQQKYWWSDINGS